MYRSCIASSDCISTNDVIDNISPRNVPENINKIQVLATAAGDNDNFSSISVKSADDKNGLEDEAVEGNIILFLAYLVLLDMCSSNRPKNYFLSYYEALPLFSFLLIINN